MKVLFATDRSTDSSQAARLLSRLRFRAPLELTVMTAVPTPEFAEPSSIPLEIRQLVQAERAQVARDLDELAGPFAGTAETVHTRLTTGNPAANILQVAEEIAAELIVMGARGQSRVDRMLLGSVSDRVATHATCSVLVIRDAGLSGAPDRSSRLMMALDGSAYDRNQIDFFKRIAWEPAPELHLVRVLETIGIFGQDVLETTQPYWLRLRREARSGLEAVQRELAEAATTSHVATIDAPHAGESLVRYADKQEIDLITVGDHGHGALHRLFLGSTSRYVLRHARASVAIARGPRGAVGPGGEA